MTECILLLSVEFLKVEDREAYTNDILNQPHETDDNFLLEIVLCNMLRSTQNYEKQIKLERKDKLNDIETKINELT